MNEEYITHDFEDTKKLGEEFAKRLKGGDTLCLYGDLGSGKTTFVQGLAKGLGIEKRIISPTFVIVLQYQINLQFLSSRGPAERDRGDLKRHSGKLKAHPESIKNGSRTSQDDVLHFYHIDLYRTENEKDIKGLGISEMMQDKNAITVIEWAEKMGNLLPQKRIDIIFKYINEDQRKIVIG